MMTYAPKRIPVEIFPADWCQWCDDPGHDTLEVCNILTIRRGPDGTVNVGPCGCTTNVVVGKQGDFIVRVTQLQKE